jgi:hypothetical protein
LPERLIGADPGYYLDWTLDDWAGAPKRSCPLREPSTDAASIPPSSMPAARALDCGHFLAGERADEVGAELVIFVSP